MSDDTKSEMTKVNEADVRKVFALAYHAIDTAIDETVALMPGVPTVVLHAAFQAAMIQRAAELAKASFNTSRASFSAAAGEFYGDNGLSNVSSPDDS